jgi:hypothetical protein
MQIPDIASRDVLVEIVDELKHRLKARISCGLIGPHKDNMLEDFDKLLNEFISRWKLDSDPHMFATLPPTSGDISREQLMTLPDGSVEPYIVHRGPAVFDGEFCGDCPYLKSEGLLRTCSRYRVALEFIPKDDKPRLYVQRCQACINEDIDKPILKALENVCPICQAPSGQFCLDGEGILARFGWLMVHYQRVETKDKTLTQAYQQAMTNCPAECKPIGKTGFILHVLSCPKAKGGQAVSAMAIECPVCHTSPGHICKDNLGVNHLERVALATGSQESTNCSSCNTKLQKGKCPNLKCVKNYRYWEAAGRSAPDFPEAPAHVLPSAICPNCGQLGVLYGSLPGNCTLICKNPDCKGRTP